MSFRFRKSHDRWERRSSQLWSNLLVASSSNTERTDSTMGQKAMVDHADEHSVIVKEAMPAEYVDSLQQGDAKVSEDGTRKRKFQQQAPKRHGKSNKSSGNSVDLLILAVSKSDVSDVTSVVKKRRGRPPKQPPPTQILFESEDDENLDHNTTPSKAEEQPSEKESETYSLRKSTRTLEKHKQSIARNVDQSKATKSQISDNSTNTRKRAKKIILDSQDLSEESNQYYSTPGKGKERQGFEDFKAKSSISELAPNSFAKENILLFTPQSLERPKKNNFEIVIEKSDASGRGSLVHKMSMVLDQNIDSEATQKVSEKVQRNHTQSSKRSSKKGRRANVSLPAELQNPTSEKVAAADGFYVYVDPNDGEEAVFMEADSAEVEKLIIQPDPNTHIDSEEPAKYVKKDNHPLNFLLIEHERKKKSQKSKEDILPTGRSSLSAKPVYNTVVGQEKDFIPASDCSDNSSEHFTKTQDEEIDEDDELQQLPREQ